MQKLAYKNLGDQIYDLIPETGMTTSVIIRDQLAISQRQIEYWLKKLQETHHIQVDNIKGRNHIWRNKDEDLG